MLRCCIDYLLISIAFSRFSHRCFSIFKYRFLISVLFVNNWLRLPSGSQNLSFFNIILEKRGSRPSLEMLVGILAPTLSGHLFFFFRSPFCTLHFVNIKNDGLIWFGEFPSSRVRVGACGHTASPQRAATRRQGRAEQPKGRKRRTQDARKHRRTVVSPATRAPGGFPAETLHVGVQEDAQL